MTSPKVGKNILKRRKSTPTIFRGRGKGAAKAKPPKREISRKTIVKYLSNSLDDAKKASPKKASPKKASPKKASPIKVLPKKASPKKASPKKPRLPLTKQEKAMRKVIESINKLGL